VAFKVELGFRELLQHLTLVDPFYSHVFAP